MRGSDADALGEVGGDLVAEVTGWVEGVHRAVAGRVFRYTGPASTPVQVLHDGISRGVYAAVRGLGGTGARAAGRIAGALLDEEAPPLDASPRGDVVIGAVNGILGDRLEDDANGLAIRLSWRWAGRDVTADELVARLGVPTGKVAVFVHGLCETEAAWRYRAVRYTGSPTGGHAQHLADELGFTPVYVRYNTGRHVSDNGADLAVALEELTLAWPVPVEAIALVGHSMGGLVSRSAAALAAEADAAWVRHLRHVVCLGAPNLGAPLERAVHVGTRALSRVAETSPFADLLNTRSVGIKDLRHGYTVESEWRDVDPDRPSPNRRGPARALPGVRYHAIAATLGQRDTGLAAEILGDLLVPLSSATGVARRGHPVAFHDHDHVRGVGHLDLLSHPAVSEHLVTALATDPV